MFKKHKLNSLFKNYTYPSPNKAIRTLESNPRDKININIANKTIVTAQSGVTKTIRKEGQVLGGTPASPNSEYLKRNALLRQLPDLLKRLES